MPTIQKKMMALSKEIDDFIRNNESNRKPAHNLPFKHFKNLHQKLSDMLIEMAKQNSGIEMPEGTKWFHENLKKLIDFLPNGKD